MEYTSLIGFYPDVQCNERIKPETEGGWVCASTASASSCAPRWGSAHTTATYLMIRNHKFGECDKTNLVRVHHDLEQAESVTVEPKSANKKEKKERVEWDVPPLAGPPANAPRAPLPVSLARFCSSLTISSRWSDTRKYLICWWVLVKPLGTCESKLKETYSTPANIALLQLPKPISVGTRLVHLSQSNVHEIVAVDEMSVESFAVFELDQLEITPHT